MPRRTLRGHGCQRDDRTFTGGGSVGGRGHDSLPKRSAGSSQRQGRRRSPSQEPHGDDVGYLYAEPCSSSSRASPPPSMKRTMLDEEEILSLGLLLVGFPPFRQKVSYQLRVRRFRAFYGVSPLAMKALYADLYNLIPDIDASVFFMSINWLKLYDTENVLSGRWGLHEDTIRLHVREYVARIQDLKELKVKWGDFEDDEVFIISVDGVHCRIQEVRKDPGAKWYSHKFHAAGVGYELGIAVRSNRLVWIKGPFPASNHDVTIFRSPGDPENGLKSMIPDGKRAVGDSGYRGEPSKIAVTRDGDSGEVKAFKARVKSRHETFNGRIKGFKILDHAFRHGFEQHQKAFESVCICVQYDIENGHGLFEV